MRRTVHVQRVDLNPEVTGRKHPVTSGERCDESLGRYNHSMTQTRRTLLDRYLTHRRTWEVVLWISVIVVWTFPNALVSWMDMKRGGRAFAPWEPFLWEYSSAVVLLALIPAQLWFDRRFPIRGERWLRNVAFHALATVPYSLVHVLAMVGLRHVGYALAGAHYDFGNWPRELGYEYLKDARTYIFLLGIVYLYRFVLLRLQGEARMLSAPDTGPPVEAIDRPERFLVRKLGTEFLIAAREIEWLEAAENYVNLHVRGRVYPLRSTMTAIQDRLDPQRFVRVHRSYIVNLDYLEQIEPLDTGDARLLLKDGTRIPCSRRYRGSLKNLGVFDDRAAAAEAATRRTAR